MNPLFPGPKHVTHDELGFPVSPLDAQQERMHAGAKGWDKVREKQRLPRGRALKKLLRKVLACMECRS